MEFLCLDFVNSSWYITHESRQDPLRSGDWLQQLAGGWGLEPLPAAMEAELEGLLEQRSQFERLLTKIAEGGKLDETDIKLINEYMDSVHFSRVLEAGESGSRLYDRPVERSWKWFMAETAASLSRLYTSEYADKLKICRNPECGWFFIDESRQGNRKWCGDTCASLIKVRRFRQRQKDKGDS